VKEAENGGPVQCFTKLQESSVAARVIRKVEKTAVSSGMLQRALSYKVTEVPEVLTASIIREISTRQHDPASQKRAIFVFAAVRTSNLT
jgi:hypothetical protein